MSHQDLIATCSECFHVSRRFYSDTATDSVGRAILRELHSSMQRKRWIAERLKIEHRADGDNNGTYPHGSIKTIRAEHSLLSDVDTNFNRATRVANGWQRDRKFVDRNSRPKPLPSLLQAMVSATLYESTAVTSRPEPC